MWLLNYLKLYVRALILIMCYIDISKSSLSNDFSSVNSQSCRFAGGFPDLSPLENSPQPLVESTPAGLYIYHLCTDLPLHSVVENMCKKGYGLCHFKPKIPSDKPVDLDDALLNRTFGSFTLLARSAEGVFRQNEMKEPEIVYKHSYNESTLITTYVRVVCDVKVDNYKLTSEKSTDSEHVLTLTSKHACVEAPHYMSGGTVFFIILLVFVAIYFIGGILVLKFIRGATGMEMIPNHEFWCNLPQLAKDGFAYLTSCGKNTPDSYEKI